MAQAAVTRRRRHAWVGARRIRDVNMHALQSIFRRASRFSAGTPSLHVRCQDVNNDARRGGFARRVRRNVDVGCVRFTGDTRRSRREGASRVARRALGASARSAARDERARRGQRYGEQSRFVARRMSKQSGSTGISSSEFRHLRNSYGVSLARMDHPSVLAVGTDRRSDGTKALGWIHRYYRENDSVTGNEVSPPSSHHNEGARWMGGEGPAQRD